MSSELIYTIHLEEHYYVLRDGDGIVLEYCRSAADAGEALEGYIARDYGEGYLPEDPDYLPEEDEEA